MGNGASSEFRNNEINDKYGVNPSSIEERDGVYYLSIEREKYKLPSEVLRCLEQANNFSHEKDADPIHDNHKITRHRNHKPTKLQI